MMKRASLKNLLIATSLMAVCLPLEAQETSPETIDPGPFNGFWEFKEPAGDTCVVIIKHGGRLSCFWAGSSARAIEKGTWERIDNILTANWEAGHVDVFKLLGENGVERSTYHQGTSLLSDADLTIRGVRIDSRIPGSLTIRQEGPPPPREPAAEEVATPLIPVNSPFVGFWKVDQSTGLLGIGRSEPYFYLKLTRSGDATVALRAGGEGQGITAKWWIEEGRAIVSWPNGRRDVLFQRKNGDWALGYYKAKDDLDRTPRNSVDAVKVEAREGDRYFAAGGFKQLTVLDIRGKWIPKDAVDLSQYISIEGWGNAYRFPAVDGSGGTDPGKWRLDNDRVEITWVDGSKDLLRMAYPMFERDSFTPGDDFTDTPVATTQVVRIIEEE